MAQHQTPALRCRRRGRPTLVKTFVSSFFGDIKDPHEAIPPGTVTKSEKIRDKSVPGESLRRWTLGEQKESAGGREFPRIKDESESKDRLKE